MNKTHISLNVKDLEQSVAFYSAMFQAQPAKLRPGYANFDLDNPPLKLALNAASSAGLSHLGVQVATSETVFESLERFQADGLLTKSEIGTNCCHALQDKVWIRDPDGHPWEIFVVKGDVPAPKAAACSGHC